MSRWASTTVTTKSRRREAADLARALLLSTQEATTVAHLSPHTLSSSIDSPDSREMELHAIGTHTNSSALSMPSSLVPVHNTWGHPPTVRTIAEDRAIPSEPVVAPSCHTSDPIVSATTPSEGLSSIIVSNTPSRQPLSAQISTIASSENHHSPLIPTSTPNAAHGKAPYSSPNMPIPSSRISNHKTSSGSSHRPLFSPTQVSPRAGESSSTESKAKPVITYGKLQNSVVGDGSPSAAPWRRQTSPLKAADAPLLPFPLSTHGISDIEGDEAVEPVEEVRETIHTPETNIEVVLPSRSKSVVKEIPMRQHKRIESPDPLDQNIQRHTSPEILSSEQVASPSAIAGPSSSLQYSRTSKSPVTETQRTNSSVGTVRVSKRQQAQKGKEEAEKEARREARRIRKEKERLEKEKDEAAARTKSRGNIEEESIVALDGPPNRKSPRRMTVRESRRNGMDTHPTEIIVLDETVPDRKDPVQVVPPVPAAQEATSRQAEQSGEPDKRKRRRGQLDEEAQYDENQGGKHTQPREAKGAKRKGKDRKQNKTVKSAVEEAEQVPPIAETPTKTVDTPLSDKEQEMEEDTTMDKVEPPPGKSASVYPAKEVSAASVAPRSESRSPLKPISNGLLSTPNHHPSPGPSTGPKGYQWKTQRQDLASVLSKFGGARQSGMSRRNKIVSLHTRIGPPVKALPPPPPKPSKKKKEDSDDDDSEGEMESDGEGGVRKKVKERGIEWFMVED